MPTSYAHYRFGQKVVYELPEKYKYFAYEYPEYFYPGLHGPDLTFYFVTNSRVVSLGNDIHKLSGKDYFKAMGELILEEVGGTIAYQDEMPITKTTEEPTTRRQRLLDIALRNASRINNAPREWLKKFIHARLDSPDDFSKLLPDKEQSKLEDILYNNVMPKAINFRDGWKRRGIQPTSVLTGEITREQYDTEEYGKWTTRTAEKKLAYLFGYMCHFALDRTGHQYVNAMDAEGVATHFEMEAEFDRLLMAKDGYDPILHYVTGHIHPEAEIAQNIKQFFPGTDTMDVYNCLFLQKYLLTLMNLPGRLPRRLYVNATKLIGLPKFGDLFMPEYPNPACFETNKELMKIFDDSIPEAVELVTGYFDSLLGKTPWDEKFNWNFEGEKVY